MSDELNLNCLVFGTKPPEYDVFTINVARARNVSALKNLIKTRKQPDLDYTSAVQLQLFKPSNGIVVDAVLEEVLGENPFGDTHFQQLLPVKPLNTIFIDPLDAAHLHILVQAPQRESHIYLTRRLFE